MFKEIEQKKIYLQILEQIKENIIDGNLKSGDRLPSERQWAEQLGVSRATIREAIRALEMIGLVKCQQGEGNFIAADYEDTLTQPLTIMFWLSKAKISQIQELRRALETESAKLAAKHMTPERYERIEKICQSIETETDESIRAELDKQFHYEIAMASENIMIKNVLLSSASLIEALIKDIRIAILDDPLRGPLIDQQHQNVLLALKNNDPLKAAMAMSQHMDLIDAFVSELQDED
ncbi:GntR family transcriptional regulator [Acetobacterium fimetarium]|uniref:GntR family transcriptional regulator n=1 Tax=Acetobacterium fimetarium TaxID=52691 RepID=A0ABR6WVR1_9FIRM|nr:FadR/GntR family transcriptional regulator [Acetobacterium fimetarium]MBC3804680.1 GntR family transcriptional regulator [Acetobacterium fimetarium]